MSPLAPWQLLCHEQIPPKTGAIPRTVKVLVQQGGSLGPTEAQKSWHAACVHA